MPFNRQQQHSDQPDQIYARKKNIYSPTNVFALFITQTRAEKYNCEKCHKTKIGKKNTYKRLP